MIRQPIAHRGLHDYNRSICENSLTSIELAKDLGFAVEVDLRLTKDEIPVVFHDKSLYRAVGIKCCIKDLTYEELKKVFIFDCFQTIPTLNQVLVLVNGEVDLLIDLKGAILNRKLERKVIEVLKEYKGVVSFQSFNPLSVRWIKAKTGWSVGLLTKSLGTTFKMVKLFAGAIDFIALNKNYVIEKNYPIIRKTKIPVYVIIG